MGPQSETAVPPPASTAHFVFFNSRGLRAGWRLAIFVGILGGIYGPFTLAVRLAQQYATPAGVSGASAPKLADLSYFLPVLLGISELIAFLVVLLVSWVMSRIERRKVGEYGLPLVKPAWSRFFTGYVLWGFLPLSLLLLSMRGLRVFYFGDFNLHGAPILYWGLLWAFAFLMVGFLEEYLSRGYALYTLADGIGFWPAATVMAVLFAWGHMTNGGETRIGIVGVFLFAIFSAVTLRRTGNLWLAVGAHAGWDWGQSFFYGVSDSGIQMSGHLLNPHVQGPDWLSGGSVGPEGSVLTLLLWALMTVGFLIFYPNRREVAPSLIASDGPPE
jgi:CAAX protease family protein